VKLLFLTWDGPGTTYHETLFMPLLDAARRPGDTVEHVQLTWDADERTGRLERLAPSMGMTFRAWPVPRSGLRWLAPVVLLRLSIWTARRIRAGEVDTVLARSTLPAAATLLARRLAGDRFDFVFDADGLEADEKVEFGAWSSRGPAYKLFAFIERTAVRRAAVVLVRTGRAATILQARAKVPASRFEVVSNGKDAAEYEPLTERERLQIRADLGVGNREPLLVYVGSIGPQYRLDLMVATVAKLLDRHPEARWLVITPEQHQKQVQAACANLPAGSVIILEAAPSAVPRYLAAADLGLAYRSPTRSQQAVAPIKVGEYLLCGVPVVSSRGVGDLDRLARERALLAVDDEDAPARVVTWLIDEIMVDREGYRDDARRLGMAEFSLERGADDYRRAFDRLAG
jgi:glycosyltransferase involved in cell wall biosynthesis